MTQLTKYTPSKYISPYLSVLEDFHKDFFDRFNGTFLDNNTGDTVRFNENADRYQVEIDLPGIKKKDLQVEIVDRTVYINGSRTLTEKSGTTTSKINRSFTVPKQVDISKISVSLEDGVLTVSGPILKPDKVQRKILEIK